jgi:hypothetical protein
MWHDDVRCRLTSCISLHWRYVCDAVDTIGNEAEGVLILISWPHDTASSISLAWPCSFWRSYEIVPLQNRQDATEYFTSWSLNPNPPPHIIGPGTFVSSKNLQNIVKSDYVNISSSITSSVYICVDMMHITHLTNRPRNILTSTLDVPSWHSVGYIHLYCTGPLCTASSGSIRTSKCSIVLSKKHGGYISSILHTISDVSFIRYCTTLLSKS